MGSGNCTLQRVHCACMPAAPIGARSMLPPGVRACLLGVTLSTIADMLLPTRFVDGRVDFSSGMY